MNENDAIGGKLSLLSADVSDEKRTTLRNFLATSFPECLSEGKIDFEQLRRVLGQWIEAGQERFGLVRGRLPDAAGCGRVGGNRLFDLAHCRGSGCSRSGDSGYGHWG